MTLLENRGLEHRIEEGLLIGNRQFYISSDAAYVLRPWMQTAFHGAIDTDAQAIYTTSMSTVRVAVEWTYNDLKQIWTWNNFPRLFQVRRFQVGMLYIASPLLLNFDICIQKGGKTSKFFDCHAPSFEKYINMKKVKK